MGRGSNIFEISVAFLGLFTLCLAQRELCRTPDNEDGDCIVLTQCTVLFDILKRRPIKSEDADRLRASQCGFEVTLPKVCCPLNQNVAPSPTQSSTNYDSVRQKLCLFIGRQMNNLLFFVVISLSIVFVEFRIAQAKPADSPLLPSTEECGVGSLPDKIYGGSATALDEFPWMALIEYEKDNGKHGFYCGGVLINSRYILTAAHCVKGKDLPKSWKIVGARLGEYNTETSTDCVTTISGPKCAPPPINVAVEERIAHEKYMPYDQNQYNDIALLRLSRPITYTAFVRPICLPKTAADQAKQFTGKKLTVAGWGKTETRSESNIKLKLDVPVKENSECSRTYRQAGVQVNTGQLCAGGERGKDSCRGDSGGPLMTYSADEESQLNWFIIGVVSFGPSPCGMENWPGVYTKVANYVPWIVSKLRA